MLVNTEDFEVLEKILREKGKIQKFENECGKILGRVMITFGEIPENLKDDILSGHKEEELYIFNCSFDFYETLIGIAIGKNDMKPVLRIWVTEQEEGAERPSMN